LALRDLVGSGLVSLFFDLPLPVLDGMKSCGLLYGAAKTPHTAGNIILTV
jgi:hypothetical protein